mmetsp:Transcript_87209/g.154466  ORF Transcript_87209/g.154466 Transcript_87209/m.154466 type:complete len:207 (+) Transcript_87209:696-1316(+)
MLLPSKWLLPSLQRLLKRRLEMKQTRTKVPTSRMKIRKAMMTMMTTRLTTEREKARPVPWPGKACPRALAGSHREEAEHQQVLELVKEAKSWVPAAQLAVAPPLKRTSAPPERRGLLLWNAEGRQIPARLLQHQPLQPLQHPLPLLPLRLQHQRKQSSQERPRKTLRSKRSCVGLQRSVLNEQSVWAHRQLPHRSRQRSRRQVEPP